jgi:uncharacterized protein (DUF488 family)
VPAKPLFTIGYEGSDLDDFLATLVAYRVARVIDIRELPLSRKQGFSKSALSDALAARDIAYVHIKPLGDPKPGREAARRGEFAAFRKIYRKHLNGPDAQAGLDFAARLAGERASCLLCFERIPAHCHRTIVAKALCEKAGFALVHLEVSKDAVLHRNEGKNFISDPQLAIR